MSSQVTREREALMDMLTDALGDLACVVTIDARTPPVRQAE